MENKQFKSEYDYLLQVLMNTGMKLHEAQEHIAKLLDEEAFEYVETINDMYDKLEHVNKEEHILH